MYKTKTLNLRSQDRSNQSTVYDGFVSVGRCEFQLEKPIALREKGLVGLRSAYVPITFKTIDRYNDRFVIKFLPAVASPDGDCVFVVCQLAHGFYNSSSAISTEVNRVLGLLNATTATAIVDSEGGLTNQYSTDTTAILSGDMTCALGTSSKDLDHLIITLPAGVVFSGAGVVDRDGGTIGATGLVGGFQIYFGDEGGDVNKRLSVDSRTANKVLGFGSELRLPTTHNGDNYHPSPSTIFNRGVSDLQSETGDYMANQMRTPYIYVRSNLTRDCRESLKNGNPSNLLAKIPVSNTTYGSMAFYEPRDGSSLYFDIPAGDYSNVTISLTDGDDRLLDFNENDYELVLCWKSGSFY